MIFDGNTFICRIKTASLFEILYRLNRKWICWKLKRNLNGDSEFLKLDDDYLFERKTIQCPSFHKLRIVPFKAPMLKSSGAEFNRDNECVCFEKQAKSIFFPRISLAHIDIRMVWEGARLQNITLLLFQNLSKQSSQKSDYFIAKYAVLNWIKENPFLYGPHYLSPMELGLRVPVFFYCLKILDTLTVGQEKNIETAAYQHTWWISRNLALYSSLGNHTICEAVGLIFGGAIFSHSKEGEKWLKRGIELLETELSHQILDDGGPAEQSINYHRFVLDLYWLAMDFLETNHLHNCSGWCDRLKKAEKFWSAFNYAPDNVPAIGDSDDGYAIAPGMSMSGGFDQTCQKANERILKNESKIMLPHPPSPFMERGVGGEVKEGDGGCRKKRKWVSITFLNAGYTVVRAPQNIFLTFDHGPLGMPPLYNHGHADALSITLYKNQTPFFIDPGTYKYNGVPEHRRYFKGTMAHNTVCIDGEDQARQLTGFVWDKPYDVKWQVLENENRRFHIQANHNGYVRLKAPVIHKRSLIVNNDQTISIKDTFSGKGLHAYALNFHLHPDVVIKEKQDGLLLLNGNESIYMAAHNASFKKISGQTNPLLGWYSPAYGLLEKTTTLQCIKKGAPDATHFYTQIHIHPKI